MSVKHVRPSESNSDMRHENLRILKCKDQQFKSDFLFSGQNSAFAGLVLSEEGMHDDGSLNVCNECSRFLMRDKIPPFSLANGLYRGQLPAEFADLTWVEEMACCVYRTTAHVVRLFNSSDPKNPRVFHGNVSAHPMNIIDTAEVLPRTPHDLLKCISIVFIGPYMLKSECLKKIFSVRKFKIIRFLRYLKHVACNPLYQSITISGPNADLFPVDGPIPNVDGSVIHDATSDPGHVFHEESAGLDNHPADDLAQDGEGDSGEPIVFLENVGIMDPETVDVKSSSATAAALRSIFMKSSDGPDVIFRHGSTFIPEYHNPALFPGMFPMLFPYGCGGFEQERDPPISFERQANYFLDICDRSFRKHHLFLFVVLNMMQRRSAHLHTFLLVKRDRFSSVAKTISTLDADMIQRVADRLEKEKFIENPSDEEKQVQALLRETQAISGKVPGSSAYKIGCRSEIRAFMGYFGMPVLFFTCNPNAVHSPLFQVIYGDKSVDLSTRFPTLVSYNERALRLAEDPVAAADFFEFSFKCIFEYLFGWDFVRSCSKRAGGICQDGGGGDG